MILQNTIRHTFKWKKVVSVLLLSFVMLIGCSEKNDNASQAKEQDEITAVEEVFDKLEDKYDARLGIFALDTNTNQTVTYRPDERFAYASTHKVFTVGALLQQNAIADLSERITYTNDDLVNYNPVTEKHVDTGMTLEELSEASLRYSDNTADNLIMAYIGGPSELKKALREIGDDVTNPVRFEPELNDVEPGETHDTSTPRALTTSLQAFTLGDALPVEKRELLTDWLKGNATGDTLIRAGVPDDWEVADKSGSASYGTRNDIAIIWPPEGEPIVLAILSSHDQKDAETNDELIEEATKEVIDILGVEHAS
ncbi:beta-lactamase class A [Virgibacillus halotolerans]|uniref:class A beta-lactamase n=1 Tax=Virgibacillus halotolerans TaxID=1071053 RepID=UPI001961FAF2|nr:class A beta-lactamase [Virgibacillus halotolerans]MBM7599128.1 beta-lactamase class A [Virgibacillus halotolerans]